MVIVRTVDQERARAMAGRPGVVLLYTETKPNTDDMRDAPSLAVCKSLVARGAALRGWDPAAMREAARRLESLGKKVAFARHEYDALAGSDALIIMTEWN